MRLLRVVAAMVGFWGVAAAGTAVADARLNDACAVNGVTRPSVVVSEGLITCLNGVWLTPQGGRYAGNGLSPTEQAVLDTLSGVHSEGEACSGPGVPSASASGAVLLCTGGVWTAAVPPSGSVGASALVDGAVGARELAVHAVTSDALTGGAIRDATVAPDAAISGTKIAPDFGAQSVVTTGRVEAGTVTATHELRVVGAPVGLDAARLRSINALYAGAAAGSVCDGTVDVVTTDSSGNVLVCFGGKWVNKSSGGGSGLTISPMDGGGFVLAQDLDRAVSSACVPFTVTNSTAQDVGPLSVMLSNSTNFTMAGCQNTCNAVVRSGQSCVIGVKAQASSWAVLQSMMAVYDSSASVSTTLRGTWNQKYALFWNSGRFVAPPGVSQVRVLVVGSATAPYWTTYQGGDNCWGQTGGAGGEMVRATVPVGGGVVVTITPDGSSSFGVDVIANAGRTLGGSGNPRGAGGYPGSSPTYDVSGFRYLSFSRGQGGSGAGTHYGRPTDPICPGGPCPGSDYGGPGTGFGAGYGGRSCHAREIIGGGGGGGGGLLINGGGASPLGLVYAEWD